jgi:hypothetical protein
VIGTEANKRRHSLRRRIALEIFHNVLDNSVELVTWKYAVCRRFQPAGTRNMPDQVNRQNIGE